uniref:Uncharacterized protein n=1 Tax=Leersia perrieri TaxID=77586 RepID=A0A0D9X9C5_9ORYZ
MDQFITIKASTIVAHACEGKGREEGAVAPASGSARADGGNCSSSPADAALSGRAGSSVSLVYIDQNLCCATHYTPGS